MNGTDVLVLVVLLVLFSLIAPLAYLSWVRKTERYNTEAWGPLLRAFGYGAFIGTFVSAILEAIFLAVYAQVLQPDLGLPSGSTGNVVSLLVLAVVIAPFIEEGMKGAGVYGMRSRIRYVADGLVFGAAVGFGFSFIENLLYGVSAYGQAGLAGFLATIIVRSFSSSLLHGSATAMTGLGVAESELRKGKGHLLAGYYLLAVTMHGTFNALASLPLILSLYYPSLPASTQNELSVVALLAAIIFAVSVFSHVRTRITEMQYQGVHGLPIPTAGYAYPSMRTSGRR
ncbi:MAG: PrsW family intramembrane metalloprotease [Euryarchaeota archaeon]|nr:PrsW family intramembrane metalloprotease [Euryarchaeota archaeon]MDE1837764.1 PrsW family intramembrane metalloprotease [Euryarchaeota archaeon]MDE1880197.1 PrsW family intramembrane metalloprotease [Euryarchaeota archaeon]MDE2045414.1 PrsW family intramembrane metalloprotease [Thermoplasmata archaeon]